MTFRRVETHEADPAYALLAARTEEIIARGTGQYTGPLPRHVYDARSEKGQNWLAEQDGRLVGVVSLIENGINKEWEGVYKAPDHLWVASLFVGLDSRHRGIGDALLAESRKRAQERGLVLLLDCYLDSGFLEPYYAARGFRTLATTKFVYPGRALQAALMVYG